MAMECKQAMICKFSEISAFDTSAASKHRFYFSPKRITKKLLFENKIISTMPNFEGPNG